MGAATQLVVLYVSLPSLLNVRECETRIDLGLVGENMWWLRYCMKLRLQYLGVFDVPHSGLLSFS